MTRVICCEPGLVVDGLVRMVGEVFELDWANVPAYEARGDIFLPGARTVDWWHHPGRVLEVLPLEREPVHARAPSPGALRIAQGCAYDPGQAGYRFHSAVNEYTKHASAFVRFGHSNPYCDLRQYDGEEQIPTVRQLIHEADVLHCHMDYTLFASAGFSDGRTASVRMQPRPDQLVIRHYHGSVWGDGARQLIPHAAPLDRSVGAVVIGARLTHLADGARYWLPIPMPVERYQALRRAERRPADGVFRVAHSPTVDEYKGTAAFTAAVERLQARGVPIEAVLIKKLQHGPALVAKARCDAVFDSFWLGLQGSGLEGGAMGLPCVAGDASVRALYQEHVGHVPYTFAADAAELESVLERLAVDRAWRDAEADRLAAYVRAYHDYPAVARRYERILSEALNRADVHTEAAEPARAVA